MCRPARYPSCRSTTWPCDSPRMWRKTYTEENPGPCAECKGFPGVFRPPWWEQLWYRSRPQHRPESLWTTASIGRTGIWESLKSNAEFMWINECTCTVKKRIRKKISRKIFFHTIPPPLHVSTKLTRKSMQVSTRVHLSFKRMPKFPRTSTGWPKRGGSRKIGRGDWNRKFWNWVEKSQGKNICAPRQFLTVFLVLIKCFQKCYRRRWGEGEGLGTFPKSDPA